MTHVADTDALNAALATFPKALERAMVEAFFRRLGLAPSGEGDFDFIVSLLQWMETAKIPFERVFFDWFCGAAPRALASPQAAFYAAPEFSALRARLETFEPVRPERLTHAYFSGEPCTMLIDEVEALWAPISERDDWSPLQRKLESVGSMREALSGDASRYVADPYP